MDPDSLAASLFERGFAVIERHLTEEALVQTLDLHAESLMLADPRNVSLSSSGSNTRTHLVNHHPDLDHLYLDPTLLSLATRVLHVPFRLGAFLSRTILSGANAQ